MTRDASASDDAELAQAIAGGDADAEARLFQRFGGRVLFLAQRELRSRDRAEDARSETFLRALTAIRDGRLQQPDKLASFILQTTRHVVYEMRRRQRPETSILEQTERLSTPPVDLLAEREVAEAVRDTINELSPRDQACLRLCYYDELSTDEIARRLDIESERVRLVKSRALQRLRKVFASRGVTT